ncbi:N-acetylglucosamine-6-phosphate deacetylase [Pseudoruegeria sp. HB172150]|uniref:N-acetylglucosamine-6-phosphate deacetylase n=1 Tax=Pseudoruegeria sp. HB172150 TaxID=2721164 RepID=UPI001556125B|nr:N-acetylglucosamine-6-phosphate deacetylase [Pseudoruegeria sp. HB172150]
MTDGVSPGARRLFDGVRWHENAALRIENGRVAQVIPASPEADLIVPGFVDLQVNGGGGVQFNDAPSPEAIATIVAAHRKGGTTAMLVTLITDAREVTEAAIAACTQARAAGQEGLCGLHLEGPHLDPARKGTHAGELIRPMEDADLQRIVAAREGCGCLLTTVAPEAVSTAQIRTLAEAGVIVSLGHSDCTAETAQAAFATGATMATHLFNAMSQLGHRAPGLVGAVLDTGAVSTGLIADGFHVAPESMAIALRGKREPGRIFLVSDAMAATGSDLTEFTLNGRTIHRAGGRLTLTDGTLAGADITMLDAVRYCTGTLGLDLAEALRMASHYPAEAAGLHGKGHLEPGADADFLSLDKDLQLTSLWVGGEEKGAS